MKTLPALTILAATLLTATLAVGHRRPTPPAPPVAPQVIVITEDTAGYPGAIEGTLKQFIDIDEHTEGYPGPIVLR